MEKLFAFEVAKPVAAAAVAVDRYDPQRQQLVWESAGDSTLGWALCTSAHYSGWNPCHSTGSACTGTRCGTSGYAGCYACDYG